MRFIVKLLYSSIVVVVLSLLLPGVYVESITIALFVSIVLAFLNTYLKPLLILFTIPITLLTLGMFLLVINASIIFLADYLIDGFEVANFWWALLFSLLLSIAISLYESFNSSNQNRE